MDVGYMRVSTKDQNPDLQRRALMEASCQQIFEERVSGIKAERAELKKAIDYCRESDVLVVWKLDRLGRSLKDLIEKVELLKERGVGLRSLTESIDTTTPGGKLVLHVFGALAEFERDLIIERTSASLEAVRARGRRGGRPKAMDEKKAKLARAMLAEETSIEEVCEALGVSRSTLYRHLGPAATRPSQQSRA